MPWFKVDDGLHSHPKALEAGLEAMGLWVLLGSHCGFYVGQRGRVSRAAAIRIAGSARTLQRCAARLVTAGFWEPDDDGWLFHDWEIYQPTPEAIEAERLRKSEAGKVSARVRAEAKAAGRTEREHQTSTKTTPSEHDLSTKRARLEHEASTTSTRLDLAAVPVATRDEATSQRNPLQPGQHLLNSRSTGRDGLPVTRPVPSRPVPSHSDPPLAPQGGSEAKSRIVDAGTAGMAEAVAAFESAVAEATGKPFAVPNERAGYAALAHAINLHLRADGTISSAIVALREAVAEWVDAYRDKPGITAGWSTRKFRDWLAAEREAPDADEPTYAAPEQQTETRAIPPRTDADREHMRSAMAEIRGALTGKFVG